ncbi:MAG: polysaccharide deacetylase family protein [Clostridia bacterium]|nr:polysaccharide deacetylase family protein [Clostridia bacterium]
MFFVVKRKSILFYCACIVAVIVLAVSISSSSIAGVYFGETTRKIPVYSVEIDDSADRVIALTFDAAWGADKTLKIIEILKEYDAHAAFFLVGFWIDKYPDETKAIAEAGFDIGNHSENHLNMPRLSAEKIAEEITSVNKKVYDLTGKTPMYFRAPFGDYANNLMTCIEDMGMVGVQWSIDSLDWKGLGVKDITERIVPKAKSGDIVLFHNNSDHVLDALPVVLEALKNKGFRFVALSEMVLTENYYVDSQGVQRKR